MIKMIQIVQLVNDEPEDGNAASLRVAYSYCSFCQNLGQVERRELSEVGYFDPKVLLGLFAEGPQTLEGSSPRQAKDASLLLQVSRLEKEIRPFLSAISKYCKSSDM